MSASYILARSCAEPDQEFGSLVALARAIDAVRCAVAGQPGLRLTDSVVARGPELPGGKAISLRMVSADDGGRGTLIGYAFLPAGLTRPLRALLAALEAVDQREAA